MRRKFAIKYAHIRNRFRGNDVFEEYLKAQDHWFHREGSEGEVVLTSRIRYARNLKDHKFPHHASAAEQKEVLQSIRQAWEAGPFKDWGDVVELKEVKSLDRQFLMERQLISAEHAASLGERGVILNPEKGISFLINEEDHLRLQVFAGGLNLERSYAVLKKLHHFFSEKLNFAFDSRWGYLTACPTNVGGGFRVGFMVHLPGLLALQRMGTLLERLGTLGVVVRGAHGESTKIATPFFQISNQYSFGKKEEDILEQMQRVLRQIMEMEKAARGEWQRREKAVLRDRMARTLGILQKARLLQLEEAMEALSLIRLGMALGWIQGGAYSHLLQLFFEIQPAHLMKYSGKEMEKMELEAARAALVRRTLAAYQEKNGE